MGFRCGQTYRTPYRSSVHPDSAHSANPITGIHCTFRASGLPKILNHFALIIITNTVFPLGNYRTHRRNTVKIRRGAQHEYILVFLQHSLDLALQFLFADVGIVRSVQSCTFTDQCIHLPHIFRLAEVLFHENHGCGSLRYAEPVSHLLRSGTYGHRTQNGPQTAV